DLEKYGIAREYLCRLHREGVLERPERGLYILPDKDFGEHQSIAQACKKVPGGIICLLSALRFHEIGTQSPFEIWMAIDNKARTPQVKSISLHIVRFSGKAFKEGIETHNIKGIKVKVYKPAKTVVDCFKYRNKIGLDVAIEALRECWRAKKCSIDEIWHYAKQCRVSNVIRPYMEMLT
ncbi:transcriptional regulator, partial [bacterium]|nr:transcriptional regulator [bacterium]